MAILGHDRRARQRADTKLGPALLLGLGEYAWYERLPCDAARNYFLCALEGLVPAAGRELAGEPLSLMGQLEPPAPGGDWVDVLLRLFEAHPEPAAALDRALRRWVRRWRLGPPHGFCALAAMWSLMRWAASTRRGAVPDYILGFPLLLDLEGPDDGAMALRLPVAWNPLAESRADAAMRIGAELEVAVREELDRIEAACRAAGLSPTPAKRSGRDHFEWLVRYQVLGESMAGIAQKDYRDRRTVAEAIARTADLIGLPLRRPARPGRPRKASG